MGKRRVLLGKFTPYSSGHRQDAKTPRRQKSQKVELKNNLIQLDRLRFLGVSATLRLGGLTFDRRLGG